MLLYNPGKWNCLILYLENGNDLFYHFIIVLLGLAIVYVFPNMIISFDRNYDIMTGIRKSFSMTLSPKFKKKLGTFVTIYQLTCHFIIIVFSFLES